MAKILIVDDSPTDIHVIEAILSRAGHSVVSVSSGEEAVDKAIEITPDLILMDIIMPGLNGFQATRMLSKNPTTANIPIVILTTKNMETDRVWGLRQGAKEFLVKPPKESMLLDTINTCLAA
ncbi:MAG: response regulator [bacterium]